MTKFVKKQRKQKEDYENRGQVIWTSIRILHNYIYNIWEKHVVEGTRRVTKHGPKGKSAKKAFRKLTHTKGHYMAMRAL